MATEQNQKRIQSDFYTEGYATTYERYLLYDDPTDPIYEQFTKDAFRSCDISDVIMQYDHTGKVLARLSNKTLNVETDDKGLFICADLSKSRAAQDLFEEIKNGLITKMSWSFKPKNYYFDKETRTIVHTEIAKIYDVSAVSIPANDTTDIYARSFMDGEIGKRLQEVKSVERKRKILELKLKLGGF